MFVILDVLEFSAGISCDFLCLAGFELFLTLCKAWLHINYRGVYSETDL